MICPSCEGHTSKLATHGHSEQSEYEIYCKHLLVKKRGIPLWVPGPPMSSPTEYRRNGISIGDVGIINLTTGKFTFLFNILLSADHEINEGRVPNGFVPLDKSKAEKAIERSIVHDLCLASSVLRPPDSLDFAFKTTGKEGAVIVMPDGGFSEDLQNFKLLEKYIANNFKSWWEYVESEDCGVKMENGIQVVVGTDKVSSWGMATFQNAKVEEPIRFELRDDGSGSESQVQSYIWKGIYGKAGPTNEEILDLLVTPNTRLRNQCVFVRAWNVSTPCKVQEELAAFQVCSCYFGNCICDSSWRQAQPGQRYANAQTSNVSHPSNALNKYLLKMCPNADVVITKDFDWISVVTEDDITIPSAEDICARVLNSHVICEDEGVVTLEDQREVAETINEKDAYVIGCLSLETQHSRSTSDNKIGGDQSGVRDTGELEGNSSCRKDNGPCSQLAPETAPRACETHLKDSLHLSSCHLESHIITNNYYETNKPRDNADNTASLVEGVLAPGDVVGKGTLLKGDIVSLLPAGSRDDDDDDEQFRVVKELGKGSYAVVYLAHQLSRHGTSAPSVACKGTVNSEEGQSRIHMDGDGHGRKFAIECVPTARFDREELEFQMAAVKNYQSLPFHQNIVTLHKTLQTSSYLLLVLEYVPGEDLFYFLEKARGSPPSITNSDPPESASQSMHFKQQETPPTSSFLTPCPSQLLSRTRLLVIASMFAQMCDAVAACHSAGVFHRDITPENFVVTDGRHLDEGADRLNGGMTEGLVVKLSDFGLSTREEECSDMDCGHLPYMSYECRNNNAPTYSPRESDVWSLGVVLINMLYHINPWTDTAHGACPSFAAFREDPVGFFMRLFTGMEDNFAKLLARRVFCIDDGNGRLQEKRLTAAELGVWVRSSLVDLLATDEVTSGIGGGIGSPVALPRTLGVKAPLLAPALDKVEREVGAKLEGLLDGESVEQPKGVKRPSRWTLRFGKNTNRGVDNATMPPPDQNGSSESLGGPGERYLSPTPWSRLRHGKSDTKLGGSSSSGTGSHGSVAATRRPFASMGNWRAGSFIDTSMSPNETGSLGGSNSASAWHSSPNLSNVSTTATSAGSGWRSGLGWRLGDVHLPNVENTDDIPLPLNKLPQDQQPSPDLGSPANRARTRGRKGKYRHNKAATTSTASDASPTMPTTRGNTNAVNKLDTIIERPLSGPGFGSATTTVATDGDDSNALNATGGRVKKVHKGQINVLAKMLSVLRR